MSYLCSKPIPSGRFECHRLHSEVEQQLQFELSICSGICHTHGLAACIQSLLCVYASMRNCKVTLRGKSHSRGKGCRQICQSRFLHTSQERLCKLWLFVIFSVRGFITAVLNTHTHDKTSHSNAYVADGPLSIWLIKSAAKKILCFDQTRVYTLNERISDERLLGRKPHVA